MVEFLRLWTGECLDSFQKLYQKPLIPKQHIMIPYSQIIVKYGPLIHFLSMRMEGKHKYFKSLVHAMKNVKNTGLSLARKHQLYQTYILNRCFHNNVEFGPSKENNGKGFPFWSLLEDHTFYTVPLIFIDGIKYISKKCFILSNLLKCSHLLKKKKRERI